MIAPRVVLVRPHARRAVMPADEKTYGARSAQKAPEVPAPLKTREMMIREAAYLLAEGRGFGPGKELEDWLAAEQQIDQWMAQHGVSLR